MTRLLLRDARYVHHCADGKLEIRRGHTAPAMRPKLSATSNLVHYGHPGLVTDTMVDGRFLMRDRELLTFDEKTAVTEAQSATEAMWQRFEAEDRGVPLPATDIV